MYATQPTMGLVGLIVGSYAAVTEWFMQQHQVMVADEQCLTELQQTVLLCLPELHRCESVNVKLTVMLCGGQLNMGNKVPQSAAGMA